MHPLLTKILDPPLYLSLCLSQQCAFCFFLGADHLTLEGVGGWFWKKISCKRLSEEKNCMQHKCNRKKFLRCCKKEKKMLQSYFIIPGVFKKSQQNCNHSFPLLTLNSGFDDAAKLLLHMCNALLAYHKQYYKWR